MSSTGLSLRKEKVNNLNPEVSNYFMGKNLRQKTLFLIVSFATSLTTVHAQSITGPERFTPSSWFQGIFRFDQGAQVLLADFVTFFLVWFGFYAILAAVVKLAADRAPNNIGETMTEMFLGESVGHYREVDRRNWFFWLSGLAVLAMGPYLFTYLHSVQAALVGGATIGLWLFIGVGVILVVFAILYGLGFAGDIFGDTIAPQFGSGYDSARDVAGSVGNRAQQRAGQIRNNTYIQNAWQGFQRWRNQGGGNP
jgi:hypothetical protein